MLSRHARTNYMCIDAEREQKQEETYRQMRFIFKLANMVMEANE